MSSNTTKLHRFTGGFAIGLGLGTLALAFVAFQQRAVPLDFAGATALIGIFCMAIGRVCMSDVRGDASEDMMEEAEAPAAA